MATFIELTQTQFDNLVQQAISAYPLETCGLMAGKKGQVRHLYAVKNIRYSPVAFEMDPLEQLAAMLDMEEKGWDLVAIYHSHPHGPQTPSPTDVAQAYYPEAAHVIISLSDQSQPKVRAFTIVSGSVTEIDLHLV